MPIKGQSRSRAKRIAASAVKWGAHLLHVATGSNCESLPWYFQHMSLPPGDYIVRLLLVKTDGNFLNPAHAVPIRIAR